MSYIFPLRACSAKYCAYILVMLLFRATFSRNGKNIFHARLRSLHREAFLTSSIHARDKSHLSFIRLPGLWREKLISIVSLYSPVGNGEGIFIGGVFPFSHADEEFDAPEDFWEVCVCVFVCVCCVCVCERAPSVSGHTSFTMPPAEAEHGGNFNQGSQRARWAGGGGGWRICVCVFVHAGAERYIRYCVRGIVMKH